MRKRTTWGVVVTVACLFMLAVAALTVDGCTACFGGGWCAGDETPADTQVTPIPQEPPAEPLTPVPPIPAPEPPPELPEPLEPIPAAGASAYSSTGASAGAAGAYSSTGASAYSSTVPLRRPARSPRSRCRRHPGPVPTNTCTPSETWSYADGDICGCGMDFDGNMAPLRVVRFIDGSPVCGVPR